jgi:hypothetical protein
VFQRSHNSKNRQLQAQQEGTLVGPYKSSVTGSVAQRTLAALQEPSGSNRPNNSPLVEPVTAKRLLRPCNCQRTLAALQEFSGSYKLNNRTLVELVTARGLLRPNVGEPVTARGLLRPYVVEPVTARGLLRPHVVGPEAARGLL